MNELHAQGKTMEEIVEVLNRTPIHPRIIPAIEAAYSLGYNSLSFLLSSSVAVRETHSHFFYIAYTMCLV